MTAARQPDPLFNDGDVLWPCELVLLRQYLPADRAAATKLGKRGVQKHDTLEGAQRREGPPRRQHKETESSVPDVLMLLLCLPLSRN